MLKSHYVFLSLVFSILLGIAIGGSGHAAEQDGWVDLFNGKDLTGWDVLKCEAVVQDGMILLKEGNGLVQTKEQYADFVLDVEWKALKPDKWDSGIYFRYTSVPKGRPWPGRYQANIRKGMEGNVGGIKGATSTGLIMEPFRTHGQRHCRVPPDQRQARLGGRWLEGAERLHLPAGRNARRRAVLVPERAHQDAALTPVSTLGVRGAGEAWKHRRT